MQDNSSSFRLSAGERSKRLTRGLMTSVGIFLGACSLYTWAQNNRTPPPRDAVAEAQRPAAVPIARVEQRKTEHDRSTVFDARNAPPSSPEFREQPKQGRVSGFDFYRDPLNADKPYQNPEDVMKLEMANKPKVMEAQRKLLESRYNLQANLDPQAKMSRGKPLPVGPTARLPYDMGEAGSIVVSGDQAAGPVSLSLAASPASGERGSGVSQDTDRNVPAAGTL